MNLRKESQNDQKTPADVRSEKEIFLSVLN